MRCANCDSAIPEGGKFCIECGAPVAQAATDATERLPDHAGGVSCENCGTRNPPGASFCVTCGRVLGAKPLAEPPASAIPFPPQPAALSAPAPAAIPAAPFAPQPHQGRSNAAMWGGVSGGIFLIGIAVLAVTDWWWPGILVVLGVTTLLGSAISGQPAKSRWAGREGAFFLLGMAVIAAFDWWWPGMLVLVGLMAIMGTVLRPKA